MKDWHKQKLVYLAGRKTPASPENIKQYLERNGTSKSHTAITTACKEPLSDILFCHDQSLRNDDDTVKRKRFQYSLKDDLSSINALTKAFNHDFDSQRKLLASPFYLGLIPGLVQTFNGLIPPLKEFTTHAYAGDLSPHHEIVGWVERGDDVSAVMQKYRLPNEYEGCIEKCLNLFTDNEFIKIHVNSMNKTNRVFCRGRDDVKPEDISCMLKTIHLTDADKKHLENALKTNPLALKFVLFFINMPFDVRYDMYTRAHLDAGMLSPPPEPETESSYTLTDWDGFFDRLNHLNSNYRFLFD